MMKDKKIVLNESLMSAIKRCVSGLTTIEKTTEYALDDDGNMKIVKQKISEKTIPPNVDVIKMIYQNCEDKIEYEKMTDEQLEAEKQKLLNKLKEEENDG